MWSCWLFHQICAATAQCTCLAHPRSGSRNCASTLPFPQPANHQNALHTRASCCLLIDSSNSGSLWLGNPACEQMAGLYFCQHLSSTTADALPPPLQIAATPSFAEFASKTDIRRMMRAAPEAPMGCPIATAPPCAFTLLNRPKLNLIQYSSQVAEPEAHKAYLHTDSVRTRSGSAARRPGTVDRDNSDSSSEQ